MSALLVVIDEPRHCRFTDAGFFPYARKTIQLVGIDKTNEDDVILHIEEVKTPCRLEYTQPFSLRNFFAWFNDKGKIVTSGEPEFTRYKVIGVARHWLWFPSFSEVDEDYYRWEIRAFDRWYRKWDYERHNGGKCD